MPWAHTGNGHLATNLNMDKYSWTSVTHITKPFSKTWHLKVTDKTFQKESLLKHIREELCLQCLHFIWIACCHQAPEITSVVPRKCTWVQEVISLVHISVPATWLLHMVHCKGPGELFHLPTPLQHLLGCLQSQHLRIVWQIPMTAFWIASWVLAPSVSYRGNLKWRTLTFLHINCATAFNILENTGTFFVNKK